MLRHFRTGPQKADVRNQLYRSLIDGVGDNFARDPSVRSIMRSEAMEMAVIADKARANVASQKVTHSISYDIAFLRTDHERRAFLREMARVKTQGISFASLTQSLNALAGFAWVRRMFQTMPDVSGTDLAINSIAGGIVTGTSSSWAAQFATYNTTWQPFGRMIVGDAMMTGPDANSGNWQVVSISATGWTWKNASGFASGDAYTWSLKQSVSQNAPLASDLNGLSTSDTSGHSAAGGTSYAYSPGDTFYSTSAKLRVDTSNNDAYLRRKAAAFLCYTLPAWTDFDFATCSPFLLASSSNDAAYPQSLLNSETRLS